MGGSSSTGAKFEERTYLGSTEERCGGSMKLLMTSSNALKMENCRDGSAAPFLGRMFLVGEAVPCGVGGDDEDEGGGF